MNEFTEKYKKMDGTFEQNHCSRTAIGIYKFRHDSTRLVKSVACYDQYYETLNYFDLFAYLKK